MSKYHNPTPYELVERFGFDWQAELNKTGYPIWDETKREWLNERIYDYFLYREIAQETGGEFFHWARIKLWQIMPTINPVAALTLGDGAAAADWQTTGKSVTDTETHDTGKSETSGQRSDKGTDTLIDKSTQEGVSKSSALDSTTPQVQLTTDENYMTGLSETGATSSGTSEQNSTQTTDGTSTTAETGTTASDATGKTSFYSYDGNEAERARRWMEAAPDILGAVYAALEPLFIQVWE